MRKGTWLVMGALLVVSAAALARASDETVCGHLGRISGFDPVCNYRTEVPGDLDPSSNCRQMNCDDATKTCAISDCEPGAENCEPSVALDGLRGACTSDGYQVAQISACPPEPVAGILIFPKVLNRAARCTP